MTGSSPFARALSALILCAFAAACAPGSVSYGAKPNIAALDQLRLGETPRAGIARLVGQPRGRGEARFTLDGVPREIMFYELVAVEGAVVDLDMLIILLKDDRYDGHFWFSSSEIVDPLGL